jgi:hypothetical protein
MWREARTVDIELIKLQTNGLFGDAAAQEKITDSFEYALIGGGEVRCETVGVHLSGFTVRLVEDVLLGETKGGGIARPGEIVELEFSYIGEVQYPTNRFSLLSS